jgi:hypothetical protein
MKITEVNMHKKRGLRVGLSLLNNKVGAFPGFEDQDLQDCPLYLSL